MTVELTQDDWSRLTRLIHSHGSVGGLELALTRPAPVEHRDDPPWTSPAWFAWRLRTSLTPAASHAAHR